MTNYQTVLTNILTSVAFAPIHIDQCRSFQFLLYSTRHDLHAIDRKVNFQLKGKS